MTLKIGVCLRLRVEAGQRKPRRFDFRVVCKANNETCQSDYYRVTFMGQKKELAFE